MWLVFLHGLPGVGKLTVARELGSATGFRVFHNHLTVDLLESTFEFGSPAFVTLREEIWLSVFREAARSDLSLIFTFAPERTVRAGFPEAAENVVRDEGGRVFFAELRCAETEIERRLADPSRTAFGKLDSAIRYRELRDAGAFEFSKLRADLALDTDELAPSDAARRIADALETGSQRRGPG